jgi:GAF domain-containing protein
MEGPPAMSRSRRSPGVFGTVMAATYLSVHRSVVHRAVASGALIPDGRTPGGQVRFLRATLDAYREAHGRGGESMSGAAVAPTHDTDVERQALQKIVQLLALQAAPEALYQHALMIIGETRPQFEVAFIGLRRPTEELPNNLDVVAHKGFSAEVINTFRALPPTGGYLSTAVIESGKPVWHEDALATLDALPRGAALFAQRLGLRAYVAIPLPGEDRSVGVLGLMSRSPLASSDREMAFLGDLASVFAVVLEEVMARHELATLISAAHEISGMAMKLAADGSAVGSLAQLISKYRQLSGATAVGVAGLGTDVTSMDAHLEALIAEARASGSQRVWPPGMTRPTKLAVSIRLRDGSYGGVGAAWREHRKWWHRDFELLNVFAAACYIVSSGVL